jgi:thioesterase domain-containing protein
MEGVHPPHTSVAELARDYAQAIRGMQPAGPYHLVGWSTGGIFAHAIAEALAADEQHCKLVLIDTPLPEILQRADLNDESRFLYDLVNFANSFSGKSMSTTYEQLRKLESSERFELALREAKQHQVLPPDASVEFVQRLVEVCQAHVKAIREYTLAPLEQSISLVRPAEKEFLAEASGQTVRGDLGWGDLGAARLTMHEVAGDHFSMMTGENVCALVELLSREVFEAPTA